MKLITQLIDSLDADYSIKHIIVGTHWTIIKSHFWGMASTVMSDKPHGEGSIKEAGFLQQMSAKELDSYAQSDNSFEASIGLACINSLIPVPREKFIISNAFDAIAEKSMGKTLAIFGHFPQMDHLRAISKSLSIFELNPGKDEYKLDKIPEILPAADVVAITSNSIINHTLDLILPFLKPDAFTIMVGPSTPLSPVLFDYGISMLAGIRVVDSKLMVQSVSQGATFRQMQGVEQIIYLK
jgi:uncharacterized protein (DUF4213/DUF364 family)